jgi:Peptidase family M48
VFIIQEVVEVFTAIALKSVQLLVLDHFNASVIVYKGSKAGKEWAIAWPSVRNVTIVSKPAVMWRISGSVTSRRYLSFFIGKSRTSSELFTRTVQRQHRPYATSIFNFWSQHSKEDLFHRLGRYLRIVRIPVIAAGIYSLGYHQGIIESHRNPHKFQEQLLDSILLDATGSKDRNEVSVEILSETDLDAVDGKKKIATSRNHQIAHVARQLVGEGYKYIDEELEKAKAKVRTKVVPTISASLEEDDATLTLHGKQFAIEERLEEYYKKDRDVQIWEEAKHRFGGRNELTSAIDPWRFVFVDNSAPNAWVTEILPKRIFITTSLLDFAVNVDEVAFVLGHELSHFILGHISKSNELEMHLKTAEIVLLSLDPSAGILTFAVVVALDWLRKLVGLSFSREHEREADDLGLTLVARCGCYDLKAGSQFMCRLNLLYKDGALLPWTNSHPPTIERSRTLYRMSEQLSAMSIEPK